MFLEILDILESKGGATVAVSQGGLRVVKLVECWFLNETNWANHFSEIASHRVFIITLSTHETQIANPLTLVFNFE